MRYSNSLWELFRVSLLLVYKTSGTAFSVLSVLLQDLRLQHRNLLLAQTALNFRSAFLDIKAMNELVSLKEMEADVDRVH